MKGKIAFLLIMFQTTVYAELMDVDKETLKDIYEYCLSSQDKSSVEEKQLLECINEELEYGDYKLFKSVKDVKAAMKDD